MGEHFMGEEFETRTVVPLTIRVVGTSAVSKVEVIKNEEIVYSTSPGQREVTLTFLDQDVSPGTRLLRPGSPGRLGDRLGKSDLSELCRVTG